MSIAFACSNDPAPLPAGFDDPALLCIKGISASTGNLLGGDKALACDEKSTGSLLVPGSPVLACDYQIAIALNVQFWDLRQPGACPVTQCGRVRIRLSDATHDKPLIDREFASAGISLDLSSFFPTGGDPQLAAGTYTLSADLINDAGNPYNPGDAGMGSAQESFQLELPTNCDTADGAAGAGGSPGVVAEGGAAGLAGSAGSSESAGAAGEPAVSTGGTSGAGGSGGSGGSPLEAGTAGG